VLTGESTVGPGGIEALLDRLGLREAVRILGYVPREDLPALYAGAVCLVHPSLFEGFGIPLVEAMQVSCPILAADGTALPEIAGDAALFFDPRDPEAIARALELVTGVSASAMARRTLELFEGVRQAATAGR
jgi:glycosyltransferase involved in cell wall biosynthesis